MKNKKKLIAYLITFSVGLLLALGMCFYFNIWTVTDKKQIMTNLSDIFLIPGAMLTCIGLLVAISDEGFFDLLTYSLSSLVIFFSRNSKEKLKEKYIDYHERKKIERDGRQSPWFMVFVGLFYMTLCGIFTILYFTI